MIRIGRTRTTRRKQRLSTFQAGLVGILFVIAISYGAYTKFANPFAGSFTIHATFANANGLLPDSLVRIAGINVGKVTGVTAAPGCSKSAQSSCQAADVTMQIQPNGLPLHKDATFAIRPRIFLEGNFFVDVSPGTPEAATVGNDYTFPIQSGTEPVQFDQLLDALPSDTRSNLQTLLEQYGKAVDVSGNSYNRSIQYWLPAYKDTAIVTHDFLGILPHDLSNYIDKGGVVSAAFDAHPEDLRNLITRLNITANAFARENTALAQTVHELPVTLATATPAFRALNAAIPPLDRFSTALLPGVRSTTHTVNVSLPFIHQLRDLVQPSELDGLTHDLDGTVPSLTKLTLRTIPLMTRGVRPVSSCVVNEIYPWSRLTLDDGNLSEAGGEPLRPVYVEAVDFLPGLAGESRVFDSNGPYIRILGNGGTLTYSLTPGLVGQSLEPISGSQPALPPNGTRPPLHSNIACETQAAITTVDQAPHAGPTQVTSDNLSAPGAKQRWLSAVRVALGSLERTASQQGLKFNVPSSVQAMLKP